MTGMVMSLLLLILAAHLPVTPADDSPDWVEVQRDESIPMHTLQVVPTHQPERRAATRRPADAQGSPPAVDRATGPAEATAERRAPDAGAEGGAAGWKQGMAALLPRGLELEQAGAELAAQAQAADLRLPRTELVSAEESPELRSIEADYPRGARRARIQGRVVLQFVVETDGRAYDIRIVESLHPICDAEAVRAVREARFRPARQNGSDIPAESRLAIRFQIHSSYGG